MPLYLEKTPHGIWKIRGTHYGVSVSRSTRTRSKPEAKQILDNLEREIFKQVHNLEPEPEPEGPTFGDAALSYIKSGRGATFDLDRVLELMGDIKLADITQSYIDQRALIGWPDAKPSTRLRAFYTPVSAILNFAQRDRMMSAFNIARPKSGPGRTDWRTPEEAEEIIAAMRGMSDMVTFLFGVGPRISEACRLLWKDVSPSGDYVTFYNTKSGYPRQVALCDRVKSVMPKRGKPDEHVWLNDTAQPWSMAPDNRHYGPALKMKRLCERAGIRHTSPHILRHSWASWQHGVYGNSLDLMQKGGWRNLSMVQRYTHTGTPDLGAAVKAAGWFNYTQQTSNISPFYSEPIKYLNQSRG